MHCPPDTDIKARSSLTDDEDSDSSQSGKDQHDAAEEVFHDTKYLIDWNIPQLFPFWNPVF